MSPNTTICPHCGASVTAGAKFCGKCGQPIPATPTCPNCGAVISATTKFCGACGQPIAQPAIGEPPPAPAVGGRGGPRARPSLPVRAAPLESPPAQAVQPEPAVEPRPSPAAVERGGGGQPQELPLQARPSQPRRASPAPAMEPLPTSAAAPSARPTPSPASKPKIPKIFLLGGAAVAVCVLAVIVLLVLNKPGKGGETLTQAETLTPAVTSALSSASAASANLAGSANPVGIASPAASPALSASPALGQAEVEEPASVSSDPVEYIVEVDADSGEVNVAVVSGQVTVADAAGTEKTISQGQQTLFPSGDTTPYDLAGDDGGASGGIPLRDLLVNNDVPADYDIYDPLFVNDEVSDGWLLEDPGQDTIVKTPDPFTLVLTVPDGNDLWGDRSTAPRLLHRATGDFDLQAEILLETKATDLVYVQFVLKAPGTMIGVLKDQMSGDTDTADYLLLPSSWYSAGGQNRIGCWLWGERTCPEGPSDFLHVRLTRRGDVFTTYTSFDGQHWNLHSQQTLLLPDTLWTGWLAKRMAYDGLTEEPAVVTLRNIHLSTAMRYWLEWPEWDFDQLDGLAEVQGNRVTMTLDGTKLGQVYATVGQPIEGDFDIIVAYDTDAWKGEAGKRPGLALFAADYDRSKGDDTYKGQVYICAYQAEDGTTPPVYTTDLSVANRWQKWTKSEVAPGNQGKLRIIRQGKAMSTYYLEETKWVQLGDFGGGGFGEPVTVALQIWNNEPEQPAAFSVTFVLEQFAVGDQVKESVKSLTETVTSVAPLPAISTPAPATGTTTGGAAPDAAAIAREQAALAPPAGYIRYVHSGADFSVNIPDIWQSLGEDAKGKYITLGAMGSETTLHIGMSEAGRDLDQVVAQWVDENGGGVVVPATETTVGHYPARQVVLDVSAYGRRIFMAAVSTPNRTFTLEIDGPATESTLSEIFEVVLSSFRVPARCGATVCPELLQNDAIAGAPAPAPVVKPEATPVGGGVFSPFTFAAGSTADYAPVDPRTTFPEGVTSVFAVYTYEGMKKGTPFVWDWYRDGQIYLEGTDATWNSDESGGGWRRLYNPEGLPAGNYELRLYVQDQLRQKGTLTIEKRPAGKPAIGRILFAEGIQDDQPVNPHKPFENFAKGTTKVYAFFVARDLSRDVSYRREWYRDGALLWTKTETLSAAVNGKVSFARYSGDDQLEGGCYELKLFLDNELVQLATFFVEPMTPSATPTRAPAATATPAASKPSAVSGAVPSVCWFTPDDLKSLPGAPTDFEQLEGAEEWWDVEDGQVVNYWAYTGLERGSASMGVFCDLFDYDIAPEWQPPEGFTVVDMPQIGEGSLVYQKPDHKVARFWKGNTAVTVRLKDTAPYASPGNVVALANIIAGRMPATAALKPLPSLPKTVKESAFSQYFKKFQVGAGDPFVAASSVGADEIMSVSVETIDPQQRYSLWLTDDSQNVVAVVTGIQGTRIFSLVYVFEPGEYTVHLEMAGVIYAHQAVTQE